MHLQILAITINPSLIGHDRYYEAGFGAPHTPTKSCPKGAGNFQELKICGHGTILALTVRIIRLALTVRIIRLAPVVIL